MKKNQIDQIKKMREMDDYQLVNYYERISVVTHQAHYMAEIDKYDEQYSILQYTREELLRRLAERNRQPRGLGW